jgi:hypothetical protein
MEQGWLWSLMRMTLQWTSDQKEGRESTKGLRWFFLTRRWSSGGYRADWRRRRLAKRMAACFGASWGSPDWAFIGEKFRHVVQGFLIQILSVWSFNRRFHYGLQGGGDFGLVSIRDKAFLLWFASPILHTQESKAAMTCGRGQLVVCGMPAAQAWCHGEASSTAGAGEGKSCKGGGALVGCIGERKGGKRWAAWVKKRREVGWGRELAQKALRNKKTLSFFKTFYNL